MPTLDLDLMDHLIFEKPFDSGFIILQKCLPLCTLDDFDVY